MAGMKEDTNPLETREWLDALDDVVKHEGRERASFLLLELAKHAMGSRLRLPSAITTPFCNTIAPAEEKMMPGDLFMERRIRSLVRWNALAMVMRGNDNDEGLGGHISSFSSSATLYDVGFNYFFRGTDDGHPGDLVFYQGHSAPGMYARSFLEGRLDEAQLDNFRREVDGRGLSSYPHPWLMPDYWQFPTVSMGLGPIQAIYQARVMKYQQDRGLVDHGDREVWCFIGDGECDEPESLGAISLAGREGMGNLNFVINCNLQRLDGPVRGNGKIIQELEGDFPRRRLERDQGDLGPQVGSPAGEGQDRPAAEAHGRGLRRRTAELQVQRRRVHPRAFLWQVSRTAGTGRRPVGRRHHVPQPRRPRPLQGVCRLCRRRRRSTSGPR